MAKRKITEIPSSWSKWCRRTQKPRKNSIWTESQSKHRFQNYLKRYRKKTWWNKLVRTYRWVYFYFPIEYFALENSPEVNIPCSGGFDTRFERVTTGDGKTSEEFGAEKVVQNSHGASWPIVAIRRKCRWGSTFGNRRPPRTKNFTFRAKGERPGSLPAALRENSNSQCVQPQK